MDRVVSGGKSSDVYTFRERTQNGMTIAEVNKVLNEFIPTENKADSQVKVKCKPNREVYRAKGSGLVGSTDITNITENRGGYNWDIM